MAGEVGVPVTIAYVCSGLLIGTLAGAILGKMGLQNIGERHYQWRPRGRQ